MMAQPREELWLQYVGLLSHAIWKFNGIALSHGIKSDQKDIELGEMLRAKLGITDQDQWKALERLKDETHNP